MHKYSSLRKPVRSFRDLEVYQQTLAVSVIVVKDIKPELEHVGFPFVEGLVNCAMSIPLWLSEGHSIRFGDHKLGIRLLEQAMAGCNKMIVYLEQAKGIYGGKLDTGLFDDLVKRYADVRTKIFRLEKAWQKFEPPRK